MAPLFTSSVGPLPFPEFETQHNVPYLNGYRNQFRPETLVDCLSPALTTYHELFTDAVANHSARPCLSFSRIDHLTQKSHDEYSTLTYGEVDQKSQALGAGLLHVLAQARPNLAADHISNYRSYNSSRHSPIIAIFSANRYEWTLTDVACQRYSFTNTALYDNLGDGVLVHVLQQTESPVVFCLGDKVAKLLAFKEQHNVNVEIIVSYDPVATALQTQAWKLGVKVHHFGQLLEYGLQHPRPFLAPSPETLFTVSFTSGTTGANPKGVLLNHRCAVLAITFLLSVTPQIENGRCFIFLPLTHIYERQTSSFALMAGYNLGYPRLTLYDKLSDPFANLIADLRLFRPHYFSIVPRVLIKFESLVKRLVSEHPQRQQLEALIADRIKLQAKADGVTGQDAKFAPLAQLREAVGFGDIVWTQTASAPANKHTLGYLKASLGIGIAQLYGLTETFGAMTRSLSYEAQPGSCGAISMTTEIKLVENKEKGYLAKNQTGEVLIRGPQVCQGYFKLPEETAASFDGDWFRSGDIGEIRDGKLYIIDRVKNFFKLAQGEYISPERIENVYLAKNELLRQLYVYGDPSRSFVVAVAGILPELGQELLGAKGPAEEVLQQINGREARTRVLRNLNRAVAPYLSGLERLGNIHFEYNPLTVERRVVTPTMKIMRPMAAKFFKERLDSMHAEGQLEILSRL